MTYLCTIYPLSATYGPVSVLSNPFLLLMDLSLLSNPYLLHMDLSLLSNPYLLLMDLSLYCLIFLNYN